MGKKETLLLDVEEKKTKIAINDYITINYSYFIKAIY